MYEGQKITNYRSFVAVGASLEGEQRLGLFKGKRSSAKSLKERGSHCV
jgi:hypothetical protein